MSDAKFVEGSTLKHIAVMTSTAGIGLMALFVVDLVDLFFLSLLGEQELAAAVGYAGTISFLTSSICIGMAIAMAALVARAVGAGAGDDAKRYVAHVSIVTLALTIPLAAGFWLTAPYLLTLIGAVGRTHELATSFLRILLPSMPVLALAMASGGVLRAIGAAKLAMSATLAGGLANAIIDPILIFGFDMGIAGAAWASVVARCTVFAVGAYGVLKSDLLGGADWSAFGGDLKRISALAGPAILTNIATPIGNSYVTATMAGFGDDAVAAYSIIGRIIPVAFGVVFALSGAVGPVIGQNFGAGKLDRARQSLLDALLIGTATVLFSALMIYVFRADIADAFSTSPGARLVWEFFATFVAAQWIFVGAQFIAHAAFNNLGRPLWSTWSNWGRATLGTFPLVWLGAEIMGPNGVLLGHAAGGVVFGIGAFIVAWRMCELKPAPGMAAEPVRMFRVPLSAQTEYRGWMGMYGCDEEERAGDADKDTADAA